MKKIVDSELILKILIEVILIGIVVFFIQNYFQNKWKPLTAAETLKRENFLNAKRDVFFQAIELANREIAKYDFYEPGKLVINKPKNVGAKYPTEFEVNTCFSKLCIYTDNKEVISLFKEIFLPNDTTRLIPLMGKFINSLRKDLGYGEEIISSSEEYKYIRIVKTDSIK